MPARLKSSKDPISVEATRTNRPEAVHFVHAVCCDASGLVLGAFGDTDRETYLRSGVKPFQLLTALTFRPQLLDECSDEELAIMTSSHSGESAHIETVRRLLARYGLLEDLLLCGTHPPYYPRAIWEYGRDEIDITSVHCNCSGKHVAMLLAVQAQDWPVETYREPDHPMQEANTARVARYIGREPDTIEYGVDGCSVPTWWVPIRDAATSFARFCSPEWTENETEKRAIGRIFDAFHHAAWQTAGTTRFGTAFNLESDGKWLGKIGGEGIFSVAFRDKGIAVVVKVQDGNSRAIPPALLYAMRSWNLISEDQLARLSEWVEVERRNSPGIPIGFMRVVGES